MVSSPILNFNSIKVQLELFNLIFQQIGDAYFNSIKVQLEHEQQCENDKADNISIP